MSSSELLRCYNKGCGKEYREEENREGGSWTRSASVGYFLTEQKLNSVLTAFFSPSSFRFLCVPLSVEKWLFNIVCFRFRSTFIACLRVRSLKWATWFEFPAILDMSYLRMLSRKQRETVITSFWVGKMAAKTVEVEKNVYASGFAKLNRKSSTETMKVARN